LILFPIDMWEYLIFYLHRYFDDTFATLLFHHVFYLYTFGISVFAEPFVEFFWVLKYLKV
jgi:hypothetical protein